MIHPIFKTVQIAPKGVARRGRVECFIDLTEFPERGSYKDGPLLCLYGTDATWISEHATGWPCIVLVCEKSSQIDLMVKKAKKEGKAVVHAVPGSVTESTLYAVGIGSPGECPPLWAKIGNDDAALVGQPKKATKTAKRKRARKDDGEFKPDDPATPDVNEAYEAVEPVEPVEPSDS